MGGESGVLGAFEGERVGKGAGEGGGDRSCSCDGKVRVRGWGGDGCWVLAQQMFFLEEIAARSTEDDTNSFGLRKYELILGLSWPPEWLPGQKHPGA